MTDVAGGINLRKYFENNAISIFLLVSQKTLEERLRNRNTDSEESIKERLKKAEYETTFKDKFDFMIQNEKLPLAVGLCESVIKIFLNDESTSI